MSKHTPGPWRYDKTTGEILCEHVLGGPNFVGRFHCGRDDNGNNARPTKADARLIIAAPEMLAMLRKVGAGSGVLSNESWKELKDLLDKLDRP